MNRDKERFEDLAYQQYKLAVDARDKLNDNYYKWMTFYYIAIGAILVAVTTLVEKDTSEINYEPLICILSYMGAFMSMVWNLSCKGYYFWSSSWIKIIKKLESRFRGENGELGVYTLFSKSVLEKEKVFLRSARLTKPADISTPKLTMLTSFIVMVAWFFFASIFVSNLITTTICCKVVLLLILGIVFFGLYIFLLNTKSLKSLGATEDHGEFEVH